MSWSYWPTIWLLLAPLVMLACIECMVFMMRAVHGHHGAGMMFGGTGAARPSFHVPARFPDGPSAFEEYRAETLRRLDHEQEEFQGFLGHLRTAKDKSEFDRFMAERRARPSPPGRDESRGLA